MSMLFEQMSKAETVQLIELDLRIRLRELAEAKAEIERLNRELAEAKERILALGG